MRQDCRDKCRKASAAFVGVRGLAKIIKRVRFIDHQQRSKAAIQHGAHIHICRRKIIDAFFALDPRPVDFVAQRHGAQAVGLVQQIN